MPCSRRLRGPGVRCARWESATASRSISSCNRGEDRRRVRELRKHHQLTGRNGALPATAASIIVEHAIGVGDHLLTPCGIRQIGLTGGRGIPNGIHKQIQSKPADAVHQRWLVASTGGTGRLTMRVL